MDSAVNFPDEEISGVESDRAGEKPECQYHQQSVAEIEKCRYKPCNLQLKWKMSSRSQVNTRSLSYKTIFITRLKFQAAHTFITFQKFGFQTFIKLFC